MNAASSGINQNIGHLCSTAQLSVGLGNSIAFRWLTPSLESTDYTFTALDSESNKFANILQLAGFSPGDVFFTFLPKTPELLFAFLGALKLQLITGTLFSNFGEDVIFDRLSDAQARGVITKKSLLKKVLSAEIP